MAQPMWYVVDCRECDRLLPVPFRSKKERNDWATAHKRATGHKLLITSDEPRMVSSSQ